MPRFARMRAAEVRDVRPGLQRMTLDDGSEAYALTELCGAAQAGDELLVNVSAVELGLGTGGAHVVHTNLSSPYVGAPSMGRAMKARYPGRAAPGPSRQRSPPSTRMTPTTLGSCRRWRACGSCCACCTAMRWRWLRRCTMQPARRRDTS